jgi:hypothetical protein
MLYTVFRSAKIRGQLSSSAGCGELFGAFGCYRCCRQFLEHPIDQRLGASTEVVEQPGGVLVRNYSCPVASAVRTEPCVCRALAVFFSEATGQPAVEQCLRGERLICQYLVKRPAKGTRRARSVS